MRHALAVMGIVCILLGVAGCANREQKAKEETEKGVALLQSTDRDKPDPEIVKTAMQHLLSAVELSPKLAKAHCALGTAYRFQKNYPAAIKSYGEAIQLNENYAVCIHNLGVTQMIMNDLEKSERTLLKAAAIDRNYDEVHYSLGQLYSLQGKAEQAITEYETFVKLTKNTGTARDAQKEIERLKAASGSHEGK
jgi:tetratricopeptide (TPR) repeat protein